MSDGKSRYTGWGQPYYAALARGYDHGYAAYVADEWERRHMSQTSNTGIIKDKNKCQNTSKNR